jgi:hypothetical protein
MLDLVLVVSDDGIGIQPKDVLTLFSSFRRYSHTTLLSLPSHYASTTQVNYRRTVNSPLL